MGVHVDFSYAGFIARYPEFTVVGEPRILEFFAEATIHHRNDGTGPVQDATAQLVYLNMMTAHIAWLNRLDANGQPINPLVGKINNATEGSVSVGTDSFQGISGASQWLLQSSYGVSYFHATAPYRQMRYLPGPRRNFGPIFPGWPIRY